MNVTNEGWYNIKNTGDRECQCGTWKQHWLNFSNVKWPMICSVEGCLALPILGGHVANKNIKGEKIVPICDSCNKEVGIFNLRSEVVLVSANKSETCGG